MAMENTHKQTTVYMKASGQEIFIVVLGKRLGLMVAHSKATIYKDAKMVLEFIIGKMVVITRDIGVKVKSVVLVYMLGRMVNVT